MLAFVGRRLAGAIAALLAASVLIFAAVQVLPGLHFPEVMGFQQETIQHTFIVPPENASLSR